jgi:hypothetical protein
MGNKQGCKLDKDDDTPIVLSDTVSSDKTLKRPLKLLLIGYARVGVSSLCETVATGIFPKAPVKKYEKMLTK